MAIKVLKKWPNRNDKTEVLVDVFHVEYNDEVEIDVGVHIIQSSMHTVDTVYLEENELHDLIKSLQEIVTVLPELKVKAKKDWDKGEAKRLKKAK